MLFDILSICKGGGYRYCRTNPPHPRANSKGLYPLHRVLAENKLGRLLEPGEVVHHKNEDKTDDTTENLEPKTQSKHTSDHKTVPCLNYTCRCGNTFTLKPHALRLRLKRSRDGVIYCSHSCGARFTKLEANPYCKCGQPKRPGQWNCKDCHAAHRRQYIEKQKLRNGESNTLASGV